MNIWFFVFLISLFQIWLDCILSAELDVIIFPEDGLFKIMTVTAYMAGLLVISLFLIIFIAQRLQERYSKKISYNLVILMSLIIFGLSEQLIWMLKSWYAHNVVMIEHMALYIIIPEIILGLSSYYLYQMIKDRNDLYKLPAAFIVMIFYWGNDVFLYFLIEHLLIP